MEMKNRLTVLHLINAAIRGGAEDQLARFIRSSSAEIEHIVLVMQPRGDKLTFAGINIFEGAFAVFGALYKYRHRTVILHAWLPASELIMQVWAILFATSTQANLVVSHHGPFNEKLSAYSTRTRLIIRVSHWLSHRFSQYTRIFLSAEQARDFILNVGDVKENRIRIISPFIKMPAIRKVAQSSMNRVEKHGGTIRVGMLARYDPLKSHSKIIQVIRYCNEHYDKRFILFLAGSKVEAGNEQLKRLINSMEMSDSVVLLGEISDIDTFFDLIDIHVLLSKAESFGLVTVEALLRNVPSVMSSTGVASELLDCENFRMCNVSDDISIIAEHILKLVHYCSKYSRVVGRFKLNERVPKALTRFTGDNSHSYRTLYGEVLN